MRRLYRRDPKDRVGRGSAGSLPFSNVELEVHDVAVLHHVFLAFLTE